MEAAAPDEWFNPIAAGDRILNSRDLALRPISHND
jgi:hypothetical protein